MHGPIVGPRRGPDLGGATPATGRYDRDMSDARSVLGHLLEGRAALVAEVDRLSVAIHDLDAVIARLGGDGTPTSAATRPSMADPATPPAAMLQRGVAPRRTAARRRPARSVPRVSAGGGGKSIRVHVLEMLESEQRHMGLAEIIDRVHAAGIQAHDDAVRSITVKLMKDGKVERVGRGQYRLASIPASGAPASDTPTSDTPTCDTPAVDIRSDTGGTGAPDGVTSDAAVAVR